MEIKVIGSTKKGYNADISESLAFGGIAAGICYMSSDYEVLSGEDFEKTKKRIDLTLKSGHHSVYDHPMYNFLFVDIPKILAMVLNNEGFYTTSEKSARYTKMKAQGKEFELYNKWQEIYKNVISCEYPMLDKKKIAKLAMENARYMLSVFTPTTMAYTVSLRQISSTIAMMKGYINNDKNDRFASKLKEVMKDFINKMADFDVQGLNSDFKEKKLSLFDSRKTRYEEFGENYSINYTGTFAQLAQAQRHRTLDYTMNFPDKGHSFYVPAILEYRDDLKKSWSEDIRQLSDCFVQGMLVNINERGTYENFILKAKERLCADAQLEISLRTGETLIKYLSEVEKKNPDIYEILSNYIKVDSKRYVMIPRCGFKGYICPEPCVWKLGAMKRRI